MFPLIFYDELHISYKKPSLRTTSTFLLISEMIGKILLLLLIVLLIACLPVKCMQEEKTISKKLLLDEITTDLSEKGVKCFTFPGWIKYLTSCKTRHSTLERLSFVVTQYTNRATKRLANVCWVIIRHSIDNSFYTFDQKGVKHILFWVYLTLREAIVINHKV